MHPGNPESMTCVVPSRCGVLNWYRILPLGVSESHFSDAAGRLTYRHSRSAFPCSRDLAVTRHAARTRLPCPSVIEWLIAGRQRLQSEHLAALLRAEAMGQAIDESGGCSLAPLPCLLQPNSCFRHSAPAVPGATVGLKCTDDNADNLAVDTRKVRAWTQLSFWPHRTILPACHCPEPAVAPEPQARTGSGRHMRH
jgi:hypothetical protein